jgi:hypothetical protein
MKTLEDKLDILTRNADVLDMFIFEKVMINEDLDLTKQMFLISKVDRANRAVVEALEFLGLGSIEELDEYKNEI